MEQATIEKINAEIAKLAGRVEGLDAVAGEVKSLDAAMLEIKAELAGITKAATELAEGETKSRDGLAKRLDEFEQKINRTSVDSSEAEKAAAQQKAFDEFDKTVRAGGHIEVKSLDSGLKIQDVFLDDQPSIDYPLLGMAFFKTTKSDAPNYSYPVAGAVNKKGEAAGTAGVRKKVAVTIDDIEYQPTIDRGDVEDVGGQMFLDEQTSHVEGTREYVNAAIVDAIEAAGVAAASVTDVYTQVAIYETAVISVIDDDDLNTFMV